MEAKVTTQKKSPESRITQIESNLQWWLLPALFIGLVLYLISDTVIPLFTSISNFGLHYIYKFSMISQLWPLYLLVWLELGQYFLFSKQPKKDQSNWKNNPHWLSPVWWVYLLGALLLLITGIWSFQNLAFWSWYRFGWFFLGSMLLSLSAAVFLSLSRWRFSHVRLTLLVIFVTAALCLFNTMQNMRELGQFTFATKVVWIASQSLSKLIILWAIFRLSESIFVYYRLWLKDFFFWRSFNLVINDVIQSKKSNSPVQVKKIFFSNAVPRSYNQSDSILRIFNEILRIEANSDFQKMSLAYLANRSHSAMLNRFEKDLDSNSQATGITSERQLSHKASENYLAILARTLKMTENFYSDTAQNIKHDKKSNKNSIAVPEITLTRSIFCKYSYLQSWSKLLSPDLNDSTKEPKPDIDLKDQNSWLDVVSMFFNLVMAYKKNQRLLNLYPGIVSMLEENRCIEDKEFLAFHFLLQVSCSEFALFSRIGDELGALIPLNEDIQRLLSILYKIKHSHVKTGDNENSVNEAFSTRYKNRSLLYSKQAESSFYDNGLGLKWIPGLDKTDQNSR
jgi:hypothetical protein